MKQEKNYIHEYQLQCLLLNQQNVCESYSVSDYLGGCMRLIEEQTAEFLMNFINGDIIVSPKNYDLMANILFVSKNSKFRGIKKHLKAAKKKYNELVNNAQTSNDNKNSVVQHSDVEETPQKKSGGFFNRLKNKLKNTVERLKRPVLIGGLAVLSLFAGKKVYDSVEQQDNNANVVSSGYVVSHTTSNKTDTIKPLNISRQITPINQNRVVAPTSEQQSVRNDTVINENAKKLISGLQQLKDNNPADKDMDVIATANNMYNRFGDNAKKIIYVCKMAPYALNEFTHFNFRPNTHNMIEYLSTHELTARQRAQLDNFVAQYMARQSIARAQMQNHR